MSDPEITTPSDDSADAEHLATAPSWAVSICFWCTLVLALTIYGTVALAPKFCVWNQVRLEYRHNASELLALEADVSYLERVEQALETDPEFRDRVAGVAQPVRGDGEELIPVSGSLLFGHEDRSEMRSIAPQVPRYHVFAFRIASQARLRLILLCCAALLTVFAFTFLNDAGTGFVYDTGRLMKSVALLPVARYFRSDQEPGPE
jgi:hypothetical protein